MISKDAVDRLMEHFLNEDVVIYLRDMNVVVVNENQEEVSLSAMTTGFVLDIDQDYFYLGTPDGNVTRTISHDVAQMIELAIPKEEFDLDQLETGEEIH